MQTNGEISNEEQSSVVAAAALAKEKLATLPSVAQSLTAGARSFTIEKTSQIASAASNPRVQVAAASGAGGAVVVGAGGAGVGFLAGGAVGAALGIVPGFFTFGLSVPVFGVIGAACGGVTGGAVGGTVGFTGAGAMGYHVYGKRAEISLLLSRLRRLPVSQEQPASCVDAHVEPPEEEVDLSPVSQDLAEIATKLNATETSLTPWAEIRDLREQLGAMQQSIGQQVEEASQPRKRGSLMNLSEKLTEMERSLDSAKTSWTPWNDLTDAKQHLGRALDIAHQQDVLLVVA